MATTYSFKGTADFSQHNAAVKKAGQEVDKYKEKCKGAGEEAQRMGKADFSSAYRSQTKLTNGVKGFTGAMNGASKGITGLVGKAGIWGAAIAGAFVVGRKALDSLALRSDRLRDDMNRNTAGMKAGWDAFLNSLANFNFDNIISKITSASKAARELADIIDQQETFKSISDVALMQLQNDFDELSMQLESLRAKYKIAKKQKNEAEAGGIKIQMDGVKAQMQRILEKMENHYKKQEQDAYKAAGKDSEKLGFGTSLVKPLRGDLERAIKQVVQSNSDFRNSPPQIQYAEFGKYLASHDSGNWDDSAQALKKLLDNINRMYYWRNGAAHSLQITSVYDPNINGGKGGYKKVKPGMNTGYASVETNEWARMQEENRKLVGQILKRGTLSQADYADYINGLVEFNYNFRNAIDQLESDSESDEFTKQLTAAMQSHAAYLSNLQRFNQIDNRTDVITANNGPLYTQGMIGWYEKQIEDLKAAQKKAATTEDYQGLQDRIEEYQRIIDEIMLGNASNEYIQRRIAQITAEFEKVPGKKEDKERYFQEVQRLHDVAAQNVSETYGNESIQYLETLIANVRKEISMAMDESIVNELNRKLLNYQSRLNGIVNAQNAIAFIQGELENLEASKKYATQRELPEVIESFNGLNHALNDLQNKKGSINWIQQEISLVNAEIAQLDPATSMDRINELRTKLYNLNIELAKLQKISEINIVVKSKLDLDEEKLNRYSDAANNVASSLHSVGNMFTYLAEAQQGNKDWDELSEEEQKEIERLQNWGAALDALTDTLSSVYEVYRVWQDAQNQMARAAEVVTIQQENAALAEQNMLKSTNAALTNTIAGATVEETAARMTNASAATTEGVAAGAVTSTKMGEAVASGTAQAAKLQFPYNIAAIAAVMASLASVISLVATLNKFESGGIIGGNSYYGDRQIARVNAGEMILNRRQQANLFNLINGTGHMGGGTGGEVSFRISGTDLVGVLGNHNRRMGRIS